MVDMINLAIGVVAGLVVGGILIYLLLYQNLRNAHRGVQAELMDAQAKNNQLQSSMLEEHSKAYQDRQALLLQQKRLESDLAEARARQAELEQQRADLKAQQDQQREVHLQQAEQLHDMIARLEQEQITLQDRFARESAEWDQERQNLLLQSVQFDDQTRMLGQDKAALEARLDQQLDAWERERLALQIKINTLEDNLSPRKAVTSHALPSDSALLVEQMERLRAGREALRDRAVAVPAMAVSGQSGFGEQDIQELRQQLEQARQTQRNLEETLAARDRQAEQERGALESEIEQLMERLLRVRRERGG